MFDSEAKSELTEKDYVALIEVMELKKQEFYFRLTEKKGGVGVELVPPFTFHAEPFQLVLENQPLSKKTAGKSQCHQVKRRMPGKNLRPTLVSLCEENSARRAGGSWRLIVFFVYINPP